MDKAQEILEKATKLQEDKSASLNEKYEAWQELKSVCEEIEQLSAPENIKEPHSNKARQLHILIKKQRNVALGWLKNATEKAENVEPPAFPNERKWNNVFNEKNLENLRALIIEAERIGPISENEKTYLSVAKRLEKQWMEEMQQKEESVF